MNKITNYSPSYQKLFGLEDDIPEQHQAFFLKKQNDYLESIKSSNLQRGDDE